MDGWIKIHRQLSENDLWTCEPFSRGQAWIDMILLANHKPNFFYKRGVKVNVDRGQLAWSELALSERWKWSRNKVRKFLKDLEKEHQIEQQKTNVTQVVTIKNYDKFQEKEYQKNSKRTAKGQQKDTNKNEKNGNNKQENNIMDFSGTLKEFKKMRGRIRKPLTERAEKLIMAELEKLAPDDDQKKIKILEQSIMNSWLGVFPLRTSSNKPEVLKGTKGKYDNKEITSLD